MPIFPSAQAIARLFACLPVWQYSIATLCYVYSPFCIAPAAVYRLPSPHALVACTLAVPPLLLALASFLLAHYELSAQLFVRWASPPDEQQSPTGICRKSPYYAASDVFRRTNFSTKNDENVRPGHFRSWFGHSPGLGVSVCARPELPIVTS